MELELCFSDEDLAQERQESPAMSSVSLYVPKHEQPGWFMRLVTQRTALSPGKTDRINGECSVKCIRGTGRTYVGDKKTWTDISNSRADGETQSVKNGVDSSNSAENTNDSGVSIMAVLNNRVDAHATLPDNIPSKTVAESDGWSVLDCDSAATAVELHMVACKYLAEGMPSAALAVYRFLLTEGPPAPASLRRELLDGCTRCLLQLQRPAEAIRQLQSSRPLQISQPQRTAWTQLSAQAWEQLGRPDLAVQLRQAVISAEPCNPLPWLALADTYAALSTHLCQSALLPTSGNDDQIPCSGVKSPAEAFPHSPSERQQVSVDYNACNSADSRGPDPSASSCRGVHSAITEHPLPRWEDAAGSLGSSQRRLNPQREQRWAVSGACEARALGRCALLCGRACLQEAARAGRGCVADACLRRLHAVDETLRRHGICGAALHRLTATVCRALCDPAHARADQHSDEFVDRGSSKHILQDTEDSTLEQAWESCEQFEQKWFHSIREQVHGN